MFSPGLCSSNLARVLVVIETMLGQEIVDETDEVVDMQEYAKEQWEKAQKDMIKAE